MAKQTNVKKGGNMMNVSRINITYKCKDIDEELDKKVVEFFNSLDFVCVDKVFHSIIWRRDMFFESPKEVQDTLKIKETMEKLECY